jgi:ribonuclease Z
MTPTFHARPLNNVFEDPCVYVKILREKRALLLDLGFIGRLELGNILKITDVFVTHTHMDHFMGFDTLLRALLRRAIPLRIYGPQNIIYCVEGKLRGYSWNLIKEYPITIEVYEVSEEFIKSVRFSASNEFRKEESLETKFNGIIVDEPFLKVKGLLLTHQIPVMAYSIEEEIHININKVALFEKGLPVGPWLSEFKKAIREKRRAEEEGMDFGERMFNFDGKTYSINELIDIATITNGQKISYVMDVSPTDENIERIIRFVANSNILFCEAYFLEKDKERAFQRHHLTANIAGRIAREANVENLYLMHFSPKYRHNVEDIYKEAMEEFRRTRYESR